MHGEDSVALMRFMPKPSKTKFSYKEDKNSFTENDHLKGLDTFFSDKIKNEQKENQTSSKECKSHDRKIHLEVRSDRFEQPNKLNLQSIQPKSHEDNESSNLFEKVEHNNHIFNDHKEDETILSFSKEYEISSTSSPNLRTPDIKDGIPHTPSTPPKTVKHLQSIFFDKCNKTGKAFDIEYHTDCSHIETVPKTGGLISDEYDNQYFIEHTKDRNDRSFLRT